MATKVCQEKIPEEQIIYIDDDLEPTPLQLLKKQVDSLLIPPPADTIPMVRPMYRSLGRGLQLQLLTKTEQKEKSPGANKRKTLQERRNTKALKLKVYKVAKMRMGPGDVTHAQELAKKTSAVVPLHRLQIKDDGMPVKSPAGKN